MDDNLRKGNISVFYHPTKGSIMRPKVPFEEIESYTFKEKGEDRVMVEYPFNQLIAIRSRLQRTIKNKDRELDRLKADYDKKVRSLNIEKINIKGDLRKFKLVIGEKMKDPNSKGFENSKFTILRGGKYVRAKIRVMGRVRWLHIGSVDKWANKSDSAILTVAKEKLKDHFEDAELKKLSAPST